MSIDQSFSQCSWRRSIRISPTCRARHKQSSQKPQTRRGWTIRNKGGYGRDPPRKWEYPLGYRFSCFQRDQHNWALNKIECSFLSTYKFKVVLVRGLELLCTTRSPRSPGSFHLVTLPPHRMLSLCPHGNKANSSSPHPHSSLGEREKGMCKAEGSEMPFKGLSQKEARRSHLLPTCQP